jgi:hypothetical protein
MLGASLDFQGGTLKNNTYVVNTSGGSMQMIGASGDIQLGYAFKKSLCIYGIGSVLEQSFGSNVSSGGFGYGAGLSYDVAKHFEIMADYKSYSMTLEGAKNYTSTTGEVNLAYTW